MGGHDEFACPELGFLQAAAGCTGLDGVVDCTAMSTPGRDLPSHRPRQPSEVMVFVDAPCKHAIPTLTTPHFRIRTR